MAEKDDTERSEQTDETPLDTPSCSPVPVPPKRKQGETKYAYEQRLENWRLDQAMARKADHLRGVGQDRNTAWRIVEAERRMFGDEDEQW